MAVRHRVLVAAQPEAWGVLQGILNGVADIVPVHSIEDAFQVLDHEAASIDLIVATIAFDESRMIEFLQTVKRNPPTRGIPFLCTRVLSSVLSDQMVASMRGTCMQCGATDFLDIGNLPPDSGQRGLRAAVVACLEPGEPQRP